MTPEEREEAIERLSIGDAWYFIGFVCTAWPQVFDELIGEIERQPGRRAEASARGTALTQKRLAGLIPGRYWPTTGGPAPALPAQPAPALSIVDADPIIPGVSAADAVAAARDARG